MRTMVSAFSAVSAASAEFTWPPMDVPKSLNIFRTRGFWLFVKIKEKFWEKLQPYHNF